jgi:hypothetical protein
MVVLLYVSIVFGLALYFLGRMIDPIFCELRECKELLQGCKAELAEHNLRNREHDRAAYFERWGTYPDHWKTSTPPLTVELETSSLNSAR